MTERRKRCAEAVKKSGQDGFLFALGASFQYITETKSCFWQRNCMNHHAPVSGASIIPEALVYLDCEGQTTIITIPSIKDHFDTGKNTVVVSFLDQFEDELRHVVTGKKIGLGRDCDAWMITTLKEAVPEAVTEPVETYIEDLRLFKDAEEIDALRKMAKFTDDAVMYVVNHMRRGMTSWEGERMIIDYALMHGVQDLSFAPTVGFKTHGTENAQDIEPFETERILEEGTMVAFDIGYMNQGYCSDWGRTVYCGKAPELVRRGYEVLEEAQCYMISQIVPGKTKFGELYGMICDYCEEHGYYEYLRFRRDEIPGGNGHNIGIECHENPWLYVDCEVVIQPGMVFCSEPKMFFKNEGYMRVEDMILITENGAESLTKFPRNLFEIDFPSVL